MDFKKKYIVLVDVIKRKVKRLREQRSDLERLIEQGVASNIQKQEFVVIKAKIEAYEDAIDLAEGMIKEE